MRHMTPTGSRSSAPNGASEELVAVESGTESRVPREDESRPAAYSDSEELVTAESDMATEEAREERRHASYSDSEELTPAATSRDERTRSRARRPSASGGRSSERSAAQESPRARAVSRTADEASGRLRPWTRADTDLSKALSQVLRHRSTLRLDDAGFAHIKDVLDNPRIKSHRPTSTWLHYIIKANDKRRFALDETGTRVRAVQGHSVPTTRRNSYGSWPWEISAASCRLVGCTRPTSFTSPPLCNRVFSRAARRVSRFRRHIHLAMSRNPTAGLRSGSEVILEIDLARAHNSGCTFFVSENGVLLTEDVIPPPCIVHATRTDNGAVHELRKFRSAHKRVCTASGLYLPAAMCLNDLTSLAAISAQQMLPPLGRLPSRSRLELSSFTGLHFSRHRSTDTRRRLLASSCSFVATFTRCPRRRVDSPWKTFSRDPTLQAKHLLPHAPDADPLRSRFGLRLAMQPGTPIGRERRYSWKTTAGRSVVSTPPTREAPSPPDAQGRLCAPTGRPTWTRRCDTSPDKEDRRGGQDRRETATNSGPLAAR